MRAILDRVDEGNSSFTQINIWMQNVDRSLLDISYRVTNVENSFAKTAPTIDEFIKIKQKITGAGIAGKWLWTGFGMVLGVLISMRDLVFHWFVKGNGS